MPLQMVLSWLIYPIVTISSFFITIVVGSSPAELGSSLLSDNIGINATPAFEFASYLLLLVSDMDAGTSCVFSY